MTRSFVTRMLGSLGLHVMAWMAALAVTFVVLEGARPAPAKMLALAALFLAIKGGVAILTGSFRELWRHTGIEDLVRMIAAGAIASCLLFAVLAAAPNLNGSPWLALVDAGFSLGLLSALRVSTRIAYELIPQFLATREHPIVLAGRLDAVEIETRRMRMAGRREQVVGLVIDGPPLDGARVRGIPVLSQEGLQSLLARHAAKQVRVVSPANSSFMSRLEPVCGGAGVPLRRVFALPGSSELGDDVEDLLDRPIVRLDEQSISAMVSGRRVLVTGAGGSIGSGLCRQLLRYQPEQLVLVDRSENALFQIERQLASRAPLARLDLHLLDVRDRDAVERLFRSRSPDMIFHAAAHKHVPLMERHPAEAVINNVVGTRNVFDAADAYEAEACVFISTDKAVYPSSVMGATKRVGELYARAIAARTEGRFVAVRFGNVLGSSGSVVPIFMEQIQRGGPVTVTHEEMKRFFMSIPEACQLVLQAAACGFAGDLFVLEMGAPIRILDLARRLIERSGLRPDIDIPVVFSGPRPGEKLSEQLTLATEIVRSSRYAGIWRVSSDFPSWIELTNNLDELERLAWASRNPEVLELLGTIVPEYRASSETLALANDASEEELQSAAT